MKKNEKHGKELVCSFPQCRDSGIKFCYCAYCRVPVARRNFRLRHHHADAKRLSKSISKSKSSKHKNKKHSTSTMKSSQLDNSMTITRNSAAPAGDRAAPDRGATADAVSSMLLQSFAINQKLMEKDNGGVISRNEPENPTKNGQAMQQQHHIKRDSINSIEEISRLGDSSSSNSSTGVRVMKIPCRARGMPLDHTIEVSLVFCL